MTHVREDALDDTVDALFILDRQQSLISSDNINKPLVLSRNMQNKSEWRALYASIKTD
jgi:hypothetical protein